MAQRSFDQKLAQLIERCEALGSRADPAELCRDCPELIPQLREAVDRLRRGDATPSQMGSTLTAAEGPMHPSAARSGAVTAALVPERIGEYRVVSVLGHGGMGTVYRAEQDWPKRTVALKVITAGLMTEPMRQRFRWEADVLARLEHVGIARIYEAGVATTPAGPQPFFAMELVNGLRLDEYVRRHSPPLKSRLHLLIDICAAVHHAHTKGVIHRDLKPGNILVTEEGKPKVLDFGVARAIDADIQSTMLHTESGQLVGTLPYMAPEQAAGKVKELDTWSDVYALGVIAYEILSGRLPYVVQGKPLHEAVRVICEEEPSRLSSVDRSLRGDVETIVQKALEKDKTRRYASAGELAADVKRFLDHEPIAARPPSTWYNLRKFARRNKLVVSGVALLIFVLTCGVVTSSWFAIVANQQRKQAAGERDNAKATLEFLTNDMLAGATPESIPDEKVRNEIVRAMVTPAAERVGEQFKGRPLIEASIRDALRNVLWKVGRSDLALPHAEAALSLRRRELGDDHLETIASTNNYAVVVESLGRAPEAEPVYREALERYRRVLGDDHELTLLAISNLGAVLQARGKLAEAQQMHHEALERRRRLLGDDHADTMTSMNNMGLLLKAQGKLAAAEPLYREALERRRRVLGDDHPDTLTSISNLGALLQAQGKVAESEPLDREALERRRRVLGEDHPDTLTSLNNYADRIWAVGRVAEAEPLHKQAMERRSRVLGDSHPDTISSLNNYALVLQALGRTSEAEPLHRQALERRRTLLGEDHPETIGSLNNYATLLQTLGRASEAEPLYQRALAQSSRVLGEDHPHTVTLLHNYASVIRVQGRASEAEPLARQAVTKAATHSGLGREHPSTKRFAATHAKCLDALGRHSEATAVRTEFGLPEPATSPASAPSPAARE